MVAAHERCRHAFRGLADDDGSRRGELVRVADLGDAQLFAEEVLLSAQIPERSDAGDADGDAGGAEAEGAAQAVGDDDGGGAAEAFGEARA